MPACRQAPSPLPMSFPYRSGPNFFFFFKFFAFLGQEKSLSFLNIGTSSGTRSGVKKCIGKKIGCAGRLGDRRFSAGGGSGSPSSTHRAALFPLHALIGSASTTIRRGTTQASCTRAPIGADTSGGWRSHRPPRRRRQNSYRAPDVAAAGRPLHLHAIRLQREHRPVLPLLRGGANANAHRHRAKEPA